MSISEYCPRKKVVNCGTNTAIGGRNKENTRGKKKREIDGKRKGT